jgi:hypothetical protein
MFCFLNALVGSVRGAGMPRILVVVVLTLPSTAAAQPDTAGTGFYRGTIIRGTRPGALEVAMSLCTEGSSIRGSYFYLSVGTDIALRGTHAQDGTLELEETSSKGVVTGRWTGRLGATFKGTWTPPKGNGLEFELTRVGPIPADSPPGDTGARVQRPCSDIGYRMVRMNRPGSFDGGKSTAAFFPRLVRFRDREIMARLNSSLDEAASDWFDEMRDEAENSCDGPASGRLEDANHYYETEVAVEYASHDVLSIRVRGDRGCNGPTGVNGLLDGSVTYDLRTGDRVFLDELFREDISWAEVNRLLFAYQLAEAAKPKGDECLAGYKDLDAYGLGFHVAADGLVVQPRALDLMSDVRHCWQRTLVPYAVLRTAARPGSVLERAAAAAPPGAPVRYRIRDDYRYRDEDLIFVPPPPSRP